ncbi:MAG: hypothetical protein HXY35_06340 [Chloroflexi bacterium]|nr:hypothetical protein [Chloroflexota bacterium]
MAKNINNKQEISITNSHHVKMGNTQNIVNDASHNENDEISQAFSSLYKYIKELPEGIDKVDAQKAVEALETEARKSDNADERTVRKWFNFLLDTLPDIADVAIASFINPVRGVSVAFKKIAEKALQSKE